MNYEDIEKNAFSIAVKAIEEYKASWRVVEIAI